MSPGTGAHRAVVRRCVVKRERVDRSDLVRLVRGPDGLLLVDYRNRLPGRGAWVTPERAAVELIEKKPGLVFRALKAKVNSRGLLGRVQQANLHAVKEALSFCARAGVLVGGKDGVRGVLSSGAAVGVVLASDASERLAADLRTRAAPLAVVQVPLTTDQLGQQIGKGARAALAIRRSAPGGRLLIELRRMERLR